jgi:Zn-dependent M28 family amino/carboxypeptidase
MKLAHLFLVIPFFVLSCQKDIPLVENKENVLKVAEAIDENKVFPWVEQLSELHLNDIPVDNTGFPAGELFPSDHLTRSAAVGFVSKAFADMGYAVDTVVLGSEPQVAYNVVAELKGTTKPNEVVLVAGHLDAFYGGADDNTTAIAAMLEIARAARKFQFQRTIRFVGFDLEEFGSVGSTRYIEAGYTNNVVSAVVMDLLGYSSENAGSQQSVFGVKVPDVGNYLLAIGNQKSAEITQQVVNLSYTSNIAKAVGIIAPGNANYFLSSVFTRSDHGLMWYKGTPAIFFTDGANTRNPNYHLSTDLPETINKDFLIANTKLIAATVAILAEVQP